MQTRQFCFWGFRFHFRGLLAMRFRGNNFWVKHFTIKSRWNSLGAVMKPQFCWVFTGVFYYPVIQFFFISHEIRLSPVYHQTLFHVLCLDSGHVFFPHFPYSSNPNHRTGPVNSFHPEVWDVPYGPKVTFLFRYVTKLVLTLAAPQGGPKFPTPPPEVYSHDEQAGNIQDLVCRRCISYSRLGDFPAIVMFVNSGVHFFWVIKVI